MQWKSASKWRKQSTGSNIWRMGGCTRNRHQRPTGRHLARQPLDGVVSSQTRTFHLSNLLLCSYYPTVCYVLRCYSRYSMFSRYSKLFPPTSTFHLNNLLLCCYRATSPCCMYFTSARTSRCHCVLYFTSSRCNTFTHSTQPRFFTAHWRDALLYWYSIATFSFCYLLLCTTILVNNLSVLAVCEINVVQ